VQPIGNGSLTGSNPEWPTLLLCGSHFSEKSGPHPFNEEERVCLFFALAPEPFPEIVCRSYGNERLFALYFAEKHEPSGSTG